MRFTFEGKDYVIAFAHDPSRDRAAHAGHEVTLARISVSEACGEPEHWCSQCAEQLGHIALWCNQCMMQLSHVPKAERERTTNCSIYQISRKEERVTADDNDQSAAAGGDPAAAKTLVTMGVGRCNPRDRWTREGGRLAALRHALGFEAETEAAWAAQMSSAQLKAFRAIAWEAYQTRHLAEHLRKLRADR